jgi:hypothetical protein
MRAAVSEELVASIFRVERENVECSICSLIEVRQCLLSFGAESFVFQSAIQKFKD